jgi:hypothetical protein
MTAVDGTPRRDKCGGRKRGPEGGLCARPAGWGTQHPGYGACKLHGGSTPNHNAKAERLAAGDLADRYSVPRDVHPLDGVLEQYHRYAGQVAYLERQVNELEPEALFWGVESETDRRDPDANPDDPPRRSGQYAEFEVKRKAGAAAVLEQFDRVQREYAKLGVEIIRIGLESAAQALKGRLAPQLGGVVESILAECARIAVERPNVSAADLVAAFRPAAVEQIAAFAGRVDATEIESGVA